VRICQCKLSTLACNASMHISSMSERLERIDWEDDLSSESREEIMVGLLRLDVKEERSELLDSPSVVGEIRVSKNTSCRYLESRARLKEQSALSNSSSSQWWSRR